MATDRFAIEGLEFAETPGGVVLTVRRVVCGEHVVQEMLLGQITREELIALLEESVSRLRTSKSAPLTSAA